MAKKKTNASSGKKGSADDGASTMVSADDGATTGSANTGASLSATTTTGASIADKRAAAASASNLGNDAGITMTCTKMISKNTEKLSKPEQYQSWYPAFLTLLQCVNVQSWAIAMGKTTPTHAFDPMTGLSTEVVDEEGGGGDAKAEHKAKVYDPANAWLYMLLVTYLSGAKMRTIVKQAIPNDGHALWHTLKARMEKGGAVRRRVLVQKFYRAAMKPRQTIVEWTDLLGEMRVTLADQFAYDIGDQEICGRALQGIKMLYRPARNELYVEAEKADVTWEAFTAKLHRACDVIDLDEQADAEANAAVALLAKRDAQIEALEAELASGPSETETLEQRKRRRDERIRELQAEIDTLRAEETATDTEESTNDATEEPVTAGMAFTF